MLTPMCFLAMPWLENHNNNNNITTMAIIFSISNHPFALRVFYQNLGGDPSYVKLFLYAEAC